MPFGTEPSNNAFGMSAKSQRAVSVCAPGTHLKKINRFLKKNGHMPVNRLRHVLPLGGVCGSIIHQRHRVDGFPFFVRHLKSRKALFKILLVLYIQVNQLAQHHNFRVQPRLIRKICGSTTRPWLSIAPTWWP